MPLERAIPPVSTVAQRLFARMVRRSFRHHFHAVRAQRAELLENASAPLIVYANHASWWDPLLAVLLARILMPGRRHFAAMDAAALSLYPFPGRLGIFPAEMGSAQGTAQFLRSSEALLRDGGVLWMTPQGRLSDVREFPLAFRPGLGTLALRLPDVPLLPLAVEYTFRDDRLPEVLLRFGDRQRVEAGTPLEAATRGLETALAAAMMDLQKASCAHDASAFQTLVKQSPGSGLRGLLRGRFGRPAAKSAMGRGEWVEE